MPRRLTQTKPGTHQAMKNTSFESMTVSWLMQDGWQVFIPMLDNGHQTDILISDGPHYFRLQVKTLDAKGENHLVENRWKDSNVDYVIFFARNSTWGYIAPAFSDDSRTLNHESHCRFEQSKKDFLKKFHQI